MSIYLFLGITFLFIYVLIILLLILGFYRVGEETYKTNDPKHCFSIVIACRNEEDNLENLVESISKIEYPTSKFELILVDDHSTDTTNELARTLLKYTKIQSRVIKLEDDLLGKKHALTKGIGESMFNWIVTSDADCIIPPLWLKIFDQSLIENNSLMLAAPIKYKDYEKNFVMDFQTTDLAAMMGTTMGGFGLEKPFMCNGANLLYNKEAFLEVKGFEGNYHSISGDDIFLLEKFQRNFPGRVHYVKSEYSIVETEAEGTIKGLVNQRIRWASKSSKYESKSIKMLGLFIALANLTFLLMIVGSFISPDPRLILFLSLKVLTDLWMIVVSAKYLGENINIKYYPLIALLYPVFVIVVSVLSQTRPFEWKGREYK